MTKLVRYSIMVVVIAVLTALYQPPVSADVLAGRNAGAASGRSVDVNEMDRSNLIRARWRCNKWWKIPATSSQYSRTCVKLTHISTKWITHFQDGVDNRDGPGAATLTCITESSKTWEFGVKVGATVGSRPAHVRAHLARANAFRGLRGLTFSSLSLSVEGSIAYKTTSVRRSHIEWGVPAGKYLRCLRGVWKHPFRGIAIGQIYNKSTGTVRTIRMNYIGGSAPEPTIWRKKWVS